MNSRYLMKTNSVHDISNSIKAEASSLGFSACGIAKAEAVDEQVASNYRQWLSQGNNAGMEYLENNLEKRLDPTLLYPGAKSIISLALNYYPAVKLKDDQYQFAYYAYGKDYHDVIKQKLRQLASNVGIRLQATVKSAEPAATEASTQFLGNGMLCVDTVPMLDRYWAYKAGLGWIGKNTNLIIPHSGSFFFLAEIVVDFELEYDSPMSNHCGTCTRCLEACPTGALSHPFSINASNCLSYLTIEHRGDFPEECKGYQGEHGSQSSVSTPYIYGCDRCQLVCPHNKFAEPTQITEFSPSAEFLSMRPSDWSTLTIDQYRTLFKGSAVKRAKYEGLKRNINIVDKDKVK